MTNERIEFNPAVLQGKPVVRGTRIPVEGILRKLSEGVTEADLLDALAATLDPTDARALAERIRSGLEHAEVPIDNGVVRVTVSIGIADQSPDMRTAADLLRAADGALYKAKLGGRNRIVDNEA